MLRYLPVAVNEDRCYPISVNALLFYILLLFFTFRPIPSYMLIQGQNKKNGLKC